MEYFHYIIYIWIVIWFIFMEYFHYITYMDLAQWNIFILHILIYLIIHLHGLVLLHFIYRLFSLYSASWNLFLTLHVWIYLKIQFHGSFSLHYIYGLILWLSFMEYFYYISYIDYFFIFFVPIHKWTYLIKTMRRL